MTTLENDEPNKIKIINRKYTHDIRNGHKYSLRRFEVGCTERAPGRESKARVRIQAVPLIVTHLQARYLISPGLSFPSDLTWR